MALNIVKHDASFKMADSLSPTIRKVFIDSQIAKSYASGCKKTTCIVSSTIIKFSMLKVEGDVTEMERGLK